MLWLVTPVHGRETLTRICLEQRARMLLELEAAGVKAGQVIVGDDGNLDTARELGFQILRRPNRLGLRVNDGVEWACREGEASAVAYCGSDDWHRANFFAAPVERARTSAWQAFVAPDGRRLIVVRGTSAYGHAPWIMSRALLEPCGYRPSDDDALNGIDGSIATKVVACQAGPTPRDHAGRVRWRQERKRLVRDVFRSDDSDPLRMVDFKAGGEQITPWARVVPRGPERIVLDTSTPFETLAAVYPVDLCERMERFYHDKERR